MEKVDKSGHRKRIKNKFLSLNELTNFLADYELLEMILFFSIPRRDTNTLSKDLLKHFKSINNIIYSEKEELMNFKGIGENTFLVFKILRALISNILTSKFEEKEILNSITKVIEYAKITMGNLKVETLKILFLDSKNKLIQDENVQRGTINQTAIYTREIIKRALELHASGIIILHNHPSGDSIPSSNDIIITKELKHFCLKLGIQLHDHLIISRHSHHSMKSMGII